MPLVAQSSQPDVTDACGEAGQGFICERIYDWTGNEALATASDWFLDRPLRILLVLLVAWLASRLAKRAIVRLARRIGTAPQDGRLQALKKRGLGLVRADQEDGAAPQDGRLQALRKRGLDLVRADQEDDPELAAREEAERARAAARAETLGHVLRSLALALIWTFAALVIMSEIGINLGPLIAGAGIAGIAVGFGAQSVVKDFLSGLFMMIEDDYGVGDMIDFGGTMGTVEEVSLRSTTIRDRNGTVWHVPNGQIEQVANFSQLGLRARINIEVAYNVDLRTAIRVINRVGEQMWEAEICQGRLAGPPKVSGIQELRPSAVAIRAVVETVPALPWSEKRLMEREFRLRIKEAFDANGIEMPFPQQDLWIRTEGEPSETKPAPEKLTIPEKALLVPEGSQQEKAQMGSAQTAPDNLR